MSGESHTTEGEVGVLQADKVVMRLEGMWRHDFLQRNLSEVPVGKNLYADATSQIGDEDPGGKRKGLGLLRKRRREVASRRGDGVDAGASLDEVFYPRQVESIALMIGTMVNHDIALMYNNAAFLLLQRPGTPSDPDEIPSFISKELKRSERGFAQEIKSLAAVRFDERGQEVIGEVKRLGELLDEPATQQKLWNFWHEQRQNFFGRRQDWQGC